MEEAGSTPYEEELWEQVFSRENLVHNGVNKVRVRS
jgi:hypothetical protein